jgi:hypothetical protein
MPHPVPPGRASEPRPGQHGVRPALNPRPGVLEAPFWVRWAWAGSPATPPLDRAAPSDAAGTPACPASVVRGAGRRGGDELGPAQAVKAALDRDPALGAVDGDAQAATRRRRRAAAGGPGAPLARATSSSSGSWASGGSSSRRRRPPGPRPRPNSPAERDPAPTSLICSLAAQGCACGLLWDAEAPGQATGLGPASDHGVWRALDGGRSRR